MARRASWQENGVFHTVPNGRRGWACQGRSFNSAVLEEVQGADSLVGTSCFWGDTVYKGVSFQRLSQGDRLVGSNRKTNSLRAFPKRLDHPLPPGYWAAISSPLSDCFVVTLEHCLLLGHVVWRSSWGKSRECTRYKGLLSIQVQHWGLLLSNRTHNFSVTGAKR